MLFYENQFIFIFEEESGRRTWKKNPESEQGGVRLADETFELIEGTVKSRWSYYTYGTVDRCIQPLYMHKITYSIFETKSLNSEEDIFLSH